MGEQFKAGLARAGSESGLPPICEDQVQAELARILASTAFHVPERDRRFLAYVVEETLAGRGSRIKAFSVAVEVFGRPASFDPHTDPVVGIEAGRIRRALELYYLTEGQLDPIEITIPKGGYVPVFTARDPTVVPIAATTPVDQHEMEPAAVPGSRIDRALRRSLIAIAAVVLILIAWELVKQTSVPGTPAPTSGTRVATLLVEPFADLSASGSGASISRGLWEEVVGKLAKFRELSIVETSPRGSGPEKSTALRSGARYLLTGSVLVDGEMVRLTARILNLDDGMVLWATTYERDLKVRSLLEIEADIAGEVAAAIAQPYGVIPTADAAVAEGKVPEDFAAYACTLAYYTYRIDLSPKTHSSIKNCLEDAVRRYPQYGTAWALLSLTYLDEYRFNYRLKANPPVPLDQALQSARRAVELDPTNVRGLQAEMLALYFSGDVHDALAAGAHAVALNPNDAEVVGEYGFRLALSGRWEQGCPMISRALDRNRELLGYFEAAHALCFYMKGDYRSAVHWIERANIRENPIYHLIAAAIYGQLDDRTSSHRERDWLTANAPEMLRNIRQEVEVRIIRPQDRSQFLEGLRKAGLALPAT